MVTYMTAGKSLILSITILFLLVPAMAQEDSTNPENQTTSMIQIDSKTTLIDAHWSNSGVKLIFESDMPRMATITDVNSMPDSGAGQVNFKQVKLANGRTEVQMDTTSKRGSMTVTIGVGNNLIAVSNPAKPLFSNITRMDFYLEALLVALCVPLQYIGRDKFFKMRLRQGLTRVA